jgi:homoprotocatechuate degradation regulator HpaR
MRVLKLTSKHIGRSTKDFFVSDSRPKTRFRATSRSLPIAMLRARENIMAPIRTLLNDVDVTEQQWRVLRVLAENGRMDPKDIAMQACLLNPSLTRIMQILEKKGLIHRTPDTQDRRRVHVNITDAGVALIDSVAPQSNRIFDRLEARYGKDQIETLLDMLNALSEVKL